MDLGQMFGPVDDFFDDTFSDIGGVVNDSMGEDPNITRWRNEYIFGKQGVDYQNSALEPVIGLGAKANARFDPYVYGVDTSAYGPVQTGVAASAQGIASNAARAANIADARSQQLYGTGTQQLAIGQSNLGQAYGGLNTAGQTTAGALGNAAALEGTARSFGQQAQDLNRIQGQQGQFADQLQRQYLQGTDPSAAQAQLQAGTEAALAANTSLARSSGNPAALYQAQLTNARQTQMAANQAAQLRAQEQQAVLGQALNARQQQVGTGTAAAGVLGQGAEQLQAGGQMRLATGGQQAALVGQRSDVAQAQANLGLQQLQASQGQQGVQQGMLGAANQATATRSGALASDQAAQMQRATAQQQAFEQGRGYATAAEQGRYDALVGKTADKRAEVQQGMQAGGMGMQVIGSMIGMSDERSKQHIESLRRENQALREGKAPTPTPALAGYEDPDAIIARVEREQADGGAWSYGVPTAPEQRSAAPKLDFLRKDEAQAEKDFLDAHDDEMSPRAPGAPRAGLGGIYDPWSADDAGGIYDPWGVQAQGQAQDPYQRGYQSAMSAYKAGQVSQQDEGEPSGPSPMQGLGSGLMKAGQMPFSDERSKRGVSSEADDLDDMYLGLDPVAYEYQPGEGPPGRRAGIIAQDLARTKLGRPLVMPDERGRLMVDAAQTTLANTAQLARLTDDVRRLEGRKRA